MKKLILALSFTLLFSACATVNKQAFNKEMATNIKTLTITRQDAPEKYGISIIAHPGLNFGLVGGLIAAADMESKSSTLTTALDPKITKLRERLSNQLISELGKAGYTAEMMSHPDEKDPVVLINDLRGKVASDGILATKIYAAYIAAGPTTPYYPYIRAEVALADSKNGKILYQDTFTYGYTFPESKTVHLNSRPEYQFNDIDQLVAKTDLAREGLSKGVEAIIGVVASDLAKNP
ncbi:hypothetical protein [Chitinibacter sp. S2-10]|uniref:hypothetical protein n=1 Tax=Chitinibacter sp. S2-10 TaxID=3373597 RepID=UPI00397747CE